MRGLVEAIGDTVQQVETRFGWPILEAVTDLGAARGDLIDRMGAIIGESRLGRTEAVYRAAISARIQTVRSTGRDSELQSIVGLLTGAVVRVLRQRGHVSLELTGAMALSTADEARIAAQAITALPAGIGLSRVVAVPTTALRLDTAGAGLDAGTLARSWA